MSCNSSGYMDGVPVKISEQYKPPPRITLPQNVFQRVNLIADDLSNSTYDVSFEHNVVKKIKEWRATKDKESTERRQRLDQLQEAENKQLTEVSYPSTDDLSELSSQGNNDTTHLAKTTTTTAILQPQLMNTIPFTNPSLQNSIGYKINYSDFENDTSSPFDNMELKTINDIELLAQVLSNSQIKQQDDTNQYFVINSPSSNTNSNTKSDSDKSLPNGYYNSNFSYQYPVTTAYANYTTYNQPVEYNYPVLYDNTQSNYLDSNKMLQYMPSQNPIALNYQQNPPTHQRSKSRSVPDIVKELEDELSQAKEVISKRSQNASPAPNNKRSPEFSRGTKQQMRVKSISESEDLLENPYKNLSPSMQKTAFHISQMGFPLPRTARACKAIGDNDKKVNTYGIMP